MNVCIYWEAKLANALLADVNVKENKAYLVFLTKRSKSDHQDYITNELWDLCDEKFTEPH